MLQGPFSELDAKFSLLEIIVQPILVDEALHPVYYKLRDFLSLCTGSDDFVYIQIDNFVFGHKVYRFSTFKINTFFKPLYHLFPFFYPLPSLFYYLCE